MMIPAMLEKVGFPIAVAILYFQGRVGPTILPPAGADVILLVLFIVAYRKTAASRRSAVSNPSVNDL
jgi:hypothetical protein